MKAIYLELAIARESAHITGCFSMEVKAARNGKSLKWNKGRPPVCSDWLLVAWGSCEQAN